VEQRYAYAANWPIWTYALVEASVVHVDDFGDGLNALAATPVKEG